MACENSRLAKWVYRAIAQAPASIDPSLPGLGFLLRRALGCGSRLDRPLLVFACADGTAF